jgi:hypothetical protein
MTIVALQQCSPGSRLAERWCEDSVALKILHLGIHVFGSAGISTTRCYHVPKAASQNVFVDSPEITWMLHPVSIGISCSRIGMEEHPRKSIDIPCEH